MIISEFSQVLLAIGSKDGQTNDSVADHDGAILDQHGVVDAHQEALLEHEADVAVQLVEAGVDVALLPLVTIVEGYFFGMRQQVVVERSILSLKALFLGCQSAERWRNESDDEAREGVPREGEGGSLPSDQLRQLLGEQNHVQEGLDDVDVQCREAAGPLLCILSQPLVWVGNPVVQVADLVVVHVAQVVRVEVRRQTAAVQQRQFLLDVVDARVDHRGGHGEQEQVEDLKRGKQSLD